MPTQKVILDALKTLKPIHKRNSTNLKCGNNNILINEKLKFATAVHGLVKINRNQRAREKLQKKLLLAKIDRGISDEELISEMNRLNINN